MITKSVKIWLWLSLISQHGDLVGYISHLLLFPEDLFFLSIPLETMPSTIKWRVARAELTESQPCHSQHHLHTKLGLGEVCNLSMATGRVL